MTCQQLWAWHPLGVFFLRGPQDNFKPRLKWQKNDVFDKTSGHLLPFFSFSLASTIFVNPNQVVLASQPNQITSTALSQKQQPTFILAIVLSRLFVCLFVCLFFSCHRVQHLKLRLFCYLQLGRLQRVVQHAPFLKHSGDLADSTSTSVYSPYVDTCWTYTLNIQRSTTPECTTRGSFMHKYDREYDNTTMSANKSRLLTW